MHRLRYMLIAATALVPPMPGHSATPSADVVVQLSQWLFNDVEKFWSQQVAALGGERYRPATLAFFTRQLHGVCSTPGSLAGPFYCPVNETVYLDKAFLRQLQQHASSDQTLALDYVVAHEAAHHVQNLLGTTSLVDQSRSRSTPELANRTLMTMELQADCYAGLSLRSIEARIRVAGPLDVDATLGEVATISQTRRSHLAAGQQMLDPLTHGTAAQRAKWFRRGLDSGRFNDCDTFGAEAAGAL